MAAKKRKSKKRSAANSKRPDGFVFFLDRSLGRVIVAEALRSAGAEVRVHADYFREDAADDEWLEEVGKKGWLVLTKDKRIRYRRAVFEAVVQANVRLFVLTAGNVTAMQMGEIFVKALRRMVRMAGNHDAPFIARVTKGSSVSLQDWRKTKISG
jgi:predicted nuclease of predicted toxin-antitoxin system